MGYVPPSAKETDRTYKSTTALLKWLGNHGVGKRKARQFLIRSGCDSLESMAIFLRFQLPPLECANEDCVNIDMHTMFGVNPRNARRIITDLDVMHAINLDINEEATAHLVATDQLPPPGSPMSAAAMPNSPNYANHHSLVSPPVSSTQGGHSQAGYPMRPVAEGLVGPLEAQSYDMEVPSPLDAAARDVTLELSGTGSEEYASAQTLKHWDSCVSGASYRTAQEQLTASNSLTRLPTPRGQAISESRERWSGARDDLINAGTYPRPANPAPVGGTHIPNPPPGQQQLQRLPSPHRNSGRGLGAGTIPAPYMDGTNANLPARYANLRTNSSRRGSARMTPPASPYANPSDPRSPHGRGADPMSTGNLSGPLSGRAMSGRGLFPAYDGMLAGHMQSGENPSKSIEMMPGPLLSGGTSQHLPGVPTVSHPLDPGPYHKANAQLREQLPHYNVDVSVHTRWDHVFLWCMAVVICFVYLGVRLYYLVSGKTAEFNSQNTSVPYSYVVLVGELALGCLGFYGQQCFWKQDVRFSAMESETLKHISQDTTMNGVRQTVHVLITTYTEPAVTVKECVVRCLVAPEPIYMEKHIYVCDDGHAKSEGPKKRAMVEELRVLGHTNVFYVGDRVKQPGQLNGKSANLNHVMLQKIFPGVSKYDEIPPKDIIMVIDCDHCVKPEIFNKMGPCMLDEKVAVTLVPQWFHNLIFPDCFDSANADFMLSKMPYAFGAGQCYITGTNVMIRARACFEVCKFAEQNETAAASGALEAGVDNRQLYAEDEISEDIELGTRMHASGYKSIFICEKLATGEVPLDPRSMWRQRLRWLKGGHLFILAPNSVFFRKQPHMSFYQKALYWLCPVAHFIQIWAEPIMFTLPFFCLVLDICPYGMDSTLYWTHIAHLVAQFCYSVYHREWDRVIISMQAKTGYRVLWFTSFKACVNTVMVHTGWKNPGHFKFTPKAGISSEEAAVSGVLAVSDNSENASASPGTEKATGVNAGKEKAKVKEGFRLNQVHDGLSKVTEMRKHVMPLDGTFDFWVLLFAMSMSLFAAGMGMRTLVQNNALLDWNQGDSLRWIGIVFAIADATPGLLFLGYLATYDCSPGLLKFYVPLIVTISTLAVVLIEVRVGFGFVTNS